MLVIVQIVQLAYSRWQNKYTFILGDGVCSYFSRWHLSYTDIKEFFQISLYSACQNIPYEVVSILSHVWFAPLPFYFKISFTNLQNFSRPLPVLLYTPSYKAPALQSTVLNAVRWKLCCGNPTSTEVQPKHHKRC